jgi:hypothetical protein
MIQIIINGKLASARYNASDAGRGPIEAGTVLAA